MPPPEEWIVLSLSSIPNRNAMFQGKPSALIRKAYLAPALVRNRLSEEVMLVARSTKPTFPPLTEGSALLAFPITNLPLHEGNA
jgi:hypothetical protein